MVGTAGIDRLNVTVSQFVHCSCTGLLGFIVFFYIPTPPPPSGPGPLLPRLHDHTQTHQSVVLLWTSDQPLAETSTVQHTTLTTDGHP